MLRNYVSLAFKNLWRRRFVAGINLLGLSVGIAVCALIGLFMRHEYSFDRFHDKAGRIARLNTTMKYPGASETTSAYSSFPMGAFLSEVFEKDVETVCRLTPIDRDFILQNGDKRTTIRQVFAADSTFFHVFGFRLLQGDPDEALSRPQGIVLTRKTAEAIFLTADALGKTLSKTYASPYTQADTTEFYTVTGVLDDVPATSHLQFDALLSGSKKPFWAVWNPEIEADWHALGTITYVLFRSDKTDLAALDAQIPDLLKTRMQGAQNVAHHLHPLTAIHLGSKGITADKASNFAAFDGQYLRIFGFIGLFILLIAAINYANLSTVLAGRRAREVAVRKTIGADRSAVAVQFLTEAVLTTALALLTAAAWVALGQPLLEKIDYPLAALNALQTPGVIATLLAGVLALGIVAGAYPAFLIGRVGPASVLRGQKLNLKSKNPLVTVLVSGQFVAAIMLIIGTMVCYQQMQFLQKADLGYSTDQIVSLDLGMSNLMKAQVLKEKMTQVPGVLGATVSDQVMGNGFITYGVRYVNNGKMEHVSMPCLSADEDFAGVYNMQVAAGRAFSRTGAENGSEYLINETLARRIGWTPEQALGQQIAIAWQPQYGTIVGVLKDFHFNSLHHRIEPVCVRSGNLANGISLKLAGGDLAGTLRQAEAVWRTVVADRPFEYKWADAQFAEAYRAETRFSRLTGLGAGLAVFIACLGLLGLVTFMAEQRVKEIGIRKVLGASVAAITSLLARDFLKIVVVAFVLASPLAWWTMNHWLADFAYRVEVGAWTFVAAGVAAGAVALLTVGFQSVKAALADPVKSLRND